MYDKNQYIITRTVDAKKQNLSVLLNEISCHTASAYFIPSSGAVLLFRAEDTGTITIINWGEETAKLLDEAAFLVRANG